MRADLREKNYSKRDYETMAIEDDDTASPVGDAGTDEAQKPKGRRRSFGKMRRELTED